MTERHEEWARFVGGPMDGEGIISDDEYPRLPASFVADGGKGPVGYRLVPSEPGSEWTYVVDLAIAQAAMQEMWGDREPPVVWDGERWIDRPA